MKGEIGESPRGEKSGSGTLLFVLSLPLVLTVLGSLWSGDPDMLTRSGASLAFCLFAAWVARLGLRQDGEALERPYSRRFRWPLRALGGVLVGMATTFTAVVGAGHDAIIGAGFGFGAVLGYALLYGFDFEWPTVKLRRSSRGPTDIAEIVERAYSHVERLDQARKALTSLEFQHRLGSITHTTSEILGKIEADPMALRHARPFFSVYLGKIVHAIERYAEIQSGSVTIDQEQRFRTFLVDVENTCAQQKDKLAARRAEDVDINIDILSERLRRDGLL